MPKDKRDFFKIINDISKEMRYLSKSQQKFLDKNLKEILEKGEKVEIKNLKIKDVDCDFFK